MTTTAFVLVALVAVPLAWEGYALLSADVITISEAYMRLSGWSPFVTYALSALVGHFFVQPPARYTLAHQMSEEAEVFLILWLGWAVFIMGKSLGPLPWWASLALVVSAACVGAFGWTLGI